MIRRCHRKADGISHAVVPEAVKGFLIGDLGAVVLLAKVGKKDLLGGGTDDLF